MAKIFGINGKIVGKQGAAVYAVKNGIQIMRQYNPIVFNPNTKRQALARARFKLASRIAVALAPSNKISYALRAVMGKSGTNIQTSVLLKDPSPISGVNPLTLTVAWDEVEVANGTLPVPSAIAACTFSEPLRVGTPVVDLSNILTTLPSGYGVGLVWVVYCPDMFESVTYPIAASAGGEVGAATINVPATWQGMNVHVYAYAKAIPESHLEIPTSEIPWRYPAQTSPSTYVGMGNIS